MQRRKFIQHSSLFAASAISANMLSKLLPKMLKSIGIQLWSLPKLLSEDFEGTLKLLSQMGYHEVELYGPYTFSASSAQERWKSLTTVLGFEGSGYFGHTGSEVKKMLEKYNLKSTSAHTDLDTLQMHMSQLGEAGHALGFEYVVLPAIPDDKRQSLDDYKRIAEVFNKIGAEAKRNGLKFAYHNHGYGLQEVDGIVPLHLILNGTDPDLVFLELDIYWTTAGGADPKAYLQQYKNRYHLMHIKDMKEKVHFSGDGGNSNQWIELFPYITTAGNGVLDLADIIETGKKCGVKHFYIEHDVAPDPKVDLKRSFSHLNGLK